MLLTTHCILQAKDMDLNENERKSVVKSCLK